MINTSKPSSSIANSRKVSTGETWATITTTWLTETRTWLRVSQLITNSDKTTPEYVSGSPIGMMMALTSPSLYTPSIRNISKPI